MKRCGVVLVFVVAATAWCQDAAREKTKLEGKWMLVSAEVAGEKLPEAVVKSISLTLKGDEYTVKVGEAVDKGTVRLDAAAKPKTMDITGTDGPNKGKTLLAIYELDGDTLRVCYDLAGKKRPTAFETSKERPFFLAVYQRAKG